MLVGVDVGGTFTDFVAADASGIRTYKLASSSAEPGPVVVAGMRALGGTSMAHGTTVATNAVLEGRGARTAFVTTEGFEDLLAIGRQNRPDLYDFRKTRPEPIVSRDLRFGIPERVAADGTVVRELTAEALSELATRIRESGAESVAVCLLFSFLHPDHERAIRDALPGLPVSISSEVLPEFREVERGSTTVLDAFVKPLADRYLRELEQSVAGPFFVMRSSGGVLRSPAVRARPIEMLLSGPAGGIAAAKVVADLLAARNLVTFDMGGTSADVSVIADGEPGWTTEAEIGGHPLALPVLDIASVGAGGGSIAWFDAGHALRVGPRSAGGEPGPMCYGRGGREFTIADADLLAGTLPPVLLGGAMRLDRRAAQVGARGLTATFGTEEAAVLAVQSVVRATMAASIRLALSKRGLDPR
ncbi:MAG TPA: hydantoinase/oxoprolinase family protein, partial [Thermoplasmata archaeon]|nr:hydantoinase/oxoprolinase family protein [Thermoplasmata archaeon]